MGYGVGMTCNTYYITLEKKCVIGEAVHAEKSVLFQSLDVDVARNVLLTWLLDMIRDLHMDYKCFDC